MASDELGRCRVQLNPVKPKIILLIASYMILPSHVSLFDPERPPMVYQPECLKLLLGAAIFDVMLPIHQTPHM